MRFSNYSLDTFIVDELSQIDRPKLAKAIEERQFPNFLLNSIVVMRYARNVHSLASVGIRRTESAIKHFNQACDELAELELFDKGEPIWIRLYLSGLEAIESSIIDAAIAYSSFDAIGTILGSPLSAEDGPANFNNLRALYNRIKHFDEDIAHKGMNLLSPIWLTNTSIKCIKCELAFDEMTVVLDTLTDISKFVAVEAPRMIRDGRADERPVGPSGRPTA